MRSGGAKDGGKLTDFNGKDKVLKRKKKPKTTRNLNWQETEKKGLTRNNGGKRLDAKDSEEGRLTLHRKSKHIRPRVRANRGGEWV